MITLEVQKGNMVYVYNEKNQVIRSVSGELYGYTSGSYSVKQGSMIYTYDEKGIRISSISAGR
jgi:hypothetical protein